MKAAVNSNAPTQLLPPRRNSPCHQLLKATMRGETTVQLLLQAYHTYLLVSYPVQ